jgi:deoxyribodipyrimidine photo-lyase
MTVSSTTSSIISRNVVVNQATTAAAATAALAEAAAVSSSTSSSSVEHLLSRNRVIRQRIVIHWFRNTDLRLVDNDALTYSSKLAAGNEETRRCKVIPVYCFDARIFGNHNRSPSTKTLKCGSRRAQFIIESVTNLRQRLQETYKSNLLVAYGTPADVFDRLLHQLHDRSQLDGRDDIFELDANIVCQDEPALEEREQVREVSAILTKYSPNHVTKRVQRIWGSTLYLPHKMPYHPTFKNISNRCQGFTNRMVQMHKINATLPVPWYLPFLPRLQSDMMTYMPTLSDLGYTEEQIQEATNIDTRSQIKSIRGGETVGLARIKQYIWEDDTLKDWANMRHGPIAQNVSSKFSPYLAHGCISPRTIAEEAQRYLTTRYAKDANVMVQQDLVKRDHCKYYACKHSKRLFRPRIGPVPQTRGDDRYRTPSKSSTLFRAWTDGLTGYPLIDASMRELRTTGYIPDRCRLLVASFLCNDLHYEWTYGAEYFESTCIDYNVFCNWVNWATAAGLSNGRVFEKLFYNHEFKQYDPNGDYVRVWVPELQHLPNEFVTEPWKMTTDDEMRYNIRYGIDYPYRIVLPRIKAIKHRNATDVQVVQEMIKRKISVNRIKGVKQLLTDHSNQQQQQQQHEPQQSQHEPN